MADKIMEELAPIIEELMEEMEDMQDQRVNEGRLLALPPPPPPQGDY